MPPSQPQSRSAAGLWPCVSDATHCVGLEALRKQHPQSWHEEMRWAARLVGPKATVAEALRAGGMGALLPQGPTDRDANRLKKRRDCARRLIEAHGGTVLADIDEAWLFSQRRRAPRSPILGPLSRDRVGACFTLLRQVVHAVQRRAGLPTVHAQLPPRLRRPIGEPAERDMAPWPDLELLIENGPARIRAALVLQLHVGARPGRVLALRVGDVDAEGGEVTLRVRDRRGRYSTLRYPLTARAVRALRPWHRARRKKAGDDGLLFPMRGQPDRPIKSLNRAIRRAAKKAGSAPVTMASVRLRGQAALRAALAPRGMVRGTGGVDPAVQARIQGKLPAAWEDAYGRPREHVPQRAPARCAPNQPEVGRRKRRTEPRPMLKSTPLVERDTGTLPAPQEDALDTRPMWPEFEELSRLLDGMAPPPQIVYVPAPVASPPARPQVDLTHALAFSLGLTTREVVGLVVKLVKARVGDSSAADLLAAMAAAAGAPVQAPGEQGGGAESAEDPEGWGDSPGPAGPPQDEDNGSLRAVDLLKGLRR